MNERSVMEPYLLIQVFEEGSPVKCQPLAFWTFADCFAYLEKHGVPAHPLHEQVSQRTPLTASFPVVITQNINLNTTQCAHIIVGSNGVKAVQPIVGATSFPK